MAKFFASGYLDTAAKAVNFKIRELHRHGKLPNIDQRELREIADAISEAFPTEKTVDSYQLYQKVFKRLGYKEGDLLNPEEIKEVMKKTNPRKTDLKDFSGRHNL